MISADVYKGLVALAFIAGATITVETRYQKADAASQEHQYLAAESEIGRLETELRLLELELKQLRGLSENRPLTAEELDRQEYLKQRRVIIEARLLDLTRAA
jgi:hypothetical protein